MYKKYLVIAKGPWILKGIDLAARRGAVTAIVGLSGCGKSTLALALNGAIPQRIPGVTEGRVMIDGMDTRRVSMAKLALKVGLVFQEPDNQLFLPTVEDEVAFGPENLCLPPQEIEDIVKRTLRILEIEKLKDKNPAELSGGEKHLVALAAVLSLDPEIIVVDEPTAELDDENTRLVLGALERLKNEGKTVIIVEHNFNNLTFADSILLMAEGRIVERIEGVRANELLSGKFDELLASQIK
ncbi:MAG: energy-coupling factor ABC transporter ATP-binding protein [Tepidanaerobacteraceae bacterium]|jgi:energy-coupling factor transport system ATP-binding protein|nr:energy-coupling factor ABC transporter ATP-binding protein [Tepidanaerobacteraceae bacterium]